MSSLSTVASPTAAPAPSPTASPARPNPAPQAAAPETPFSALLDSTESDPAPPPPPPPAAKPATQPSSANDSKDAQKDTAPGDQSNSADAQSAANAGDTAPTGVTTAGAGPKGASKAPSPKAGVATPDPDAAAGAKPDPGTKTDGNTDDATATTTPVAATVTIPNPVVAAVVIPVASVTPQTAAPTPSATAVAAITSTTAATGTAQTVATQALADPAAIGAATGQTGQAVQGQKPGKAASTTSAPNALATGAPQTDDAGVTNSNAPVANLAAAANGATGNGDADGANGTAAQPAGRTTKSATTDKDVGDHANSLATAQPDKLAGPGNGPPQPTLAAPTADPSAQVVPQSPTATVTVNATAASAANAQAASAAQAGAAAGLVPVSGLAVEIAARAQAGTNHFEIRLDPPDLGRIDVRLNVDKQGNVTSHLVVERSDTLNMLRQDAPQLQRALQDAGLNTSSDGLQFSLRDQGAGAQNQSFQDNGSARSAQVIIPTTDDVTFVDTARNYGRLYGLNGGLDIRV